MATASKSHLELAPMFLDASSERFSGNTVSMAACADSYFEYLLKMYLLSGKTDMDALHTWKAAMNQMRKTLVGVSREKLTYVAVSGFAGSRGGPVSTMDHLSCFVGGSLALGWYFVPKEHAEDWWLQTGIDITRSCYETYRRSPPGLGSEVNQFGDRIYPMERQYRLRPETLESLFYLYRITGNSTYRDWSWKIIQAINKTARTKYGFAKVVDTQSSSVRLEDSQETFMGAETLKYALLIQLPAEVLPLEKFVFNTEAHPFPVQF
jgi:mannosyl-oligosaccharide alpha-1,2-mannosidase